MEEIILIIHGTNLREVNEALANGWSVKHITPFSEPVAVTGNSYHCIKGEFGAYVVMTRNRNNCIDYGCINHKIFKGSNV